jgi:hypothetical protein
LVGEDRQRSGEDPEDTLATFFGGGVRRGSFVCIRHTFRGEIGTSGLDHWQFIAAFADKQSLRAVRAFYPGCHAELTRSAAAGNYVWKESTSVADTKFELGVKPIDRTLKIEWESVWASAKSGDIEAIPASIRIQSYRALRAIAADFAVAPFVVRQATLFTGPTGCGKSHTAWERAGIEAFPKDPRSKWWTGYQGQKHVVLDEFRGGIDICHLLRWCDRYPCLVETKGSSVPLLATHFWITSNTRPEQWYPELDVVTMAALLRRLTIIEMDEPYIG